MKKTLKVSVIKSAFDIINNARYGKLSDEDKIKVWRISRVLQPIAQKYEDDNNDAAKKLKPADKDFDEKVKKLFQFDQMVQANADPKELPMGISERNDFFENVWKPYNKLVADAVKDLGDKEVKVEIEPLSEEALAKLMASNEWTFAVVTLIGGVVCE